MTFLQEQLPPGVVAHVDGPYGSIVDYIDTNYEIRSWPIPESGRLVFNFLCPPAEPEMVAFLMQALEKNSPHADEFRYLVSHNGFNMYAVKFLF